MLPGLDGTGKLFEPFVSCLSGDVQPIVCVYPADASMGYSELLEFALECIPGNDPFVVLGESFSGPIAIELGGRRPPMLRGIVLVNSFVVCPRRQLVKLMSLLPNRALVDPPLVLLKYWLKQSEDGVELSSELSGVLRSLSSSLIRSRLGLIEAVDVRKFARGLDVPVCVLQSMNDMAVPQHARRLLVENLPGSEYHLLQGNHFGLQAYPKRAASIVSKFLCDVASPAVN